MMGSSQILGVTLPKQPIDSTGRNIENLEKKKSFNETAMNLAASAFISKPLIQ